MLSFVQSLLFLKIFWLSWVMNYVFFIQGVSQVSSVISCIVITESSSELLIYTQMKLGTLVWCAVDMDILPLLQAVRLVAQAAPWHNSEFDERLLIHISYSPRRFFN